MLDLIGVEHQNGLGGRVGGTVLGGGHWPSRSTRTRPRSPLYRLGVSSTKLLGALEQASVHFVVIGGFAVSAHGHLRATKDLDIVPDPDPENLERLAEVRPRRLRTRSGGGGS